MSKLSKLILSFTVSVLITGLLIAGVYAEPNKSGILTGNAVNIREAPETSANILGQLSLNAQVMVLEASNGWYKVDTGSCTGWVYSQYVSINSIVPGLVAASDVNLRQGPGTSYGVIGQLDYANAVSILGRSGNWYKITTNTGTIGWMSSQFVSVNDGNVSRGSSDKLIPEIASGDASIRQQVVDFAKKFLGVRYVWGGTSPQGFDCSGLTTYVFRNFGVSLERVAANQARQGTKVSGANLQPGDLVFFDTNGGHNYINHVGMYIGNGQFIHASSGSSSHKVVISDLWGGFYQNAFMTARRFLN